MVKILKFPGFKDIIDGMSGNDPDWRPGGRAVRGRGGNGGEHLVQVPNVEALEAEAGDHVVWIMLCFVNVPAWHTNQGF